MIANKYSLAFDIYGTIIDTTGILDELIPHTGEMAQPFMDCWRNKQLEYSWRRGLMQQYIDFSDCTRDALEFTCKIFEIDFTNNIKKELLGAYRFLPAFPEVASSLQDIQNAGYGIYVLSNGSKNAVTTLLKHAKLEEYFLDVVSVEDVQMFKPSPIVYEHFNRTTNTDKSSSWLISGNAFDVAGAIAYGMDTVWIKRSPNMVFDPGMGSPTFVTPNLRNLARKLDASLEGTF